MIEEERRQQNYEKLVETVVQISQNNTTISRKQPLEKTVSRKQKRIGSKDVSKIVKVVLETVQPEGDESENLKLLDDATKNLKDKLYENIVLDESQQSLINHYESVVSPEIKRSLLAELSKRLTLTKIRKHVNEKITNHQ